MKLYADVDLALRAGLVSDAETVEVAIEYRPTTRTALGSTWARRAVMGPATTIRLYRLRPNQQYALTVWMQLDGVPFVAGQASFRSRATGWERFDVGPYVAVNGERPGFELASFAMYPSVVAHDEIRQWFQGVVGVDAEGWVVWIYSLCMVEAWDFLPDYTIAMVARNDGSCEMLTNHGNGVKSKTGLDGDGKLYAANSQLQKIAPDGSLVAQYIQTCGGGPLNFNKLSHECRVDHASAGLEVLTTAYRGAVVPGLSAAVKMGPSQIVDEDMDTFATTVLVAWDHASNRLVELYDLTALVPPVQKLLFATTAWNTVHMSCVGNASRKAIEFHHISSVSVGPDENYIVASRNLDAVWSLRKDGGGVEWTLSSHTELASDFAFERDLDKFYQPHSALQLDNGNLLLIDDGNDRPGCTVLRTGQCFSRAIMYKLNRQNKTATVVWQFAYPDNIGDQRSFKNTSQIDSWNEVGGSVYRLDNGHYLIAFTSVDADAVNPRGAAQIIELDTDGNRTTVATLDLPIPISDEGKQGGYRFVPWRSIAGETSARPAFVR